MFRRVGNQLAVQTSPAAIALLLFTNELRRPSSRTSKQSHSPSCMTSSQAPHKLGLFRRRLGQSLELLGSFGEEGQLLRELGNLTVLGRHLRLRSGERHVWRCDEVRGRANSHLRRSNADKATKVVLRPQPARFAHVDYWALNGFNFLATTSTINCTSCSPFRSFFPARALPRHSAPSPATDAERPFERRNCRTYPLGRVSRTVTSRCRRVGEIAPSANDSPRCSGRSSASYLR